MSREEKRARGRESKSQGTERERQQETEREKQQETERERQRERQSSCGRGVPLLSLPEVVQGIHVACLLACLPAARLGRRELKLREDGRIRRMEAARRCDYGGEALAREERAEGVLLSSAALSQRGNIILLSSHTQKNRL